METRNQALSRVAPQLNSGKVRLKDKELRRTLPELLHLLPSSTNLALSQVDFCQPEQGLFIVGIWLQFAAELRAGLGKFSLVHVDTAQVAVQTRLGGINGQCFLVLLRRQTPALGLTVQVPGEPVAPGRTPVL